MSLSSRGSVEVNVTCSNLISFNIWDLSQKKYNYGLSINASKTHASLKSKERVENLIYPKGAWFVVVKKLYAVVKICLKKNSIK